MRKQFHSFVFVLSAGFSGALFSGCVATSQEIVSLRGDITQLQSRIDGMHKNQADLFAKMDSMASSMGALTPELQETQNRMSLLGQKLDDVASGFNQRMNRLSEQVSGSPLPSSPSPSEMYRAAYGDFTKGKYDLSVEGFKTFLEKYPGGELSPQAQYYLGESYYAQNELEKAQAEFELVEKNYPKSDSVAPARLKKAICLEQQGLERDAIAVYKALTKDFPGSPEAFTAKERLGTLSSSDGK